MTLVTYSKLQAPPHQSKEYTWIQGSTRSRWVAIIVWLPPTISVWRCFWQQVSRKPGTTCSHLLQRQWQTVTSGKSAKMKQINLYFKKTSPVWGHLPQILSELVWNDQVQFLLDYASKYSNFSLLKSTSLFEIWQMVRFFRIVYSDYCDDRCLMCRILE